MIQDYSLGKDSSVPLMHLDPSDLGSLVLVKKRKESENVLTFFFFCCLYSTLGNNSGE